MMINDDDSQGNNYFCDGKAQKKLKCIAEKSRPLPLQEELSRSSHGIMELDPYWIIADYWIMGLELSMQTTF